jgi:hypothetical protein
MLQAIASLRRAARLDANRRCSTPRPATTATAVAGARTTSTVARYAVRPENPESRPIGSALLLVALDHLRPSDVSRVRVPTRLL